MSGQQIGTVIGGAIGAYFGGPAGAQLGMAIGGMIGGAVDPTHINGPKIGDGQQQTATDGAPIAWVQGTAMVAGTIVQVSSRRQIRHKDNGKGGPVTVTYTAVQDFAILICESSELRGSTMDAVLMVLQDGKLVYDVRPGSAMSADSAKWKQNVDFMYGGEDQLPHPTLEAITGVGNTPAYRGSLVAVFKNFDVSQAGDRIPSFQFVVGTAATLSSVPASSPGGFPHTTSLAAPNAGGYTLAFDPGAAPNCFEIWDGATRLLRTGYYGAPSYQSTLDASLISHGAPTETIIPSIDQSAWSDPSTIFPHPELFNYLTFQKATTNATLTLKVYAPLGDWWAASLIPGIGGASVSKALSDIVQAVCLRGGLESSDIDVADLAGIQVKGYPIARQANAADCLLPLLQAYFGYASEYDAQLHFKFYGADAGVVVDRADLIEGNDSNRGAIVSNLRNQSTEFPRRIVAAYIDPAQNYTVVNVPAERQATDVIAIGDQSFQIPVVMSVDDATNAANKALKVAYATLEGTLEYSTPFANSDVYLSLATGDALQLQGKRYVLDELILGNGNLKFTQRYDRQSAYQSNVQGIIGNTPTLPLSPYSGPTTLIPMNLPAQRPQDSVGVYIAAASTDGRDSWRGCNVQVSYDGMTTWQNALQILMESTIGTVDSAASVSSEPVTIDALKYDLESATSDQLAAGANAFAVVSASDDVQLMQFGTATATTTLHQFQLTSISRSLGGTTAAPLAAGDVFTLMDAAYFLPIDPSFAGRTIYFRGVGFGEVAEDATIYSLVYAALVGSAGQQRVAEDGTPRIAEDGFNLRFTEN